MKKWWQNWLSGQKPEEAAAFPKALPTSKYEELVAEIQAGMAAQRSRAAARSAQAPSAGFLNSSLQTFYGQMGAASWGNAPQTQGSGLSVQSMQNLYAQIMGQGTGFISWDLVTDEPKPPLEVSESTEVIVGYRLWEIRPAGRQAFLESLNTRTVWPIGEPCEANRIEQHVGHNGIHAFKAPSTEAEYHASYGITKDVTMVAYGKVALWGRVIEHEHGYRAQYAYPQSIVVPASVPNAQNVARALANTYGCEARVENV